MVVEKKTLHRKFADVASYSATDKTAISVRDGVLEYLGAELDLEPADKVFTVYRSPATIANAAHLMSGIPLTDDHIALDTQAPDTGSGVTGGVVIDALDESTDSRLAVRNTLSISDTAMAWLKDKKELSLGYFADLEPHDKYDYEQKNIIPHHLAAVELGRCGPLCCFLDRKPGHKKDEELIMKKMHKAFIDADGEASLEQIVEIATGLPEAIRKVPMEKLKELLPAMQEIISYAKEQGVAVEDEGVEDEEKEKVADEEVSEDEKPKFSDADFKSKLNKEKSKFADAEVKKYAEVVTKARNFLDADFDFTGKNASQIMRDALATQSTDKFEDSELNVAFKLLRKPDTDYSTFGDSHTEGALTARIKKEMEA